MINAKSVGITTPSKLQEVLKFQFERMYFNGWSVIASVGKSPYLHAYKDVPRDELYRLGVENINNFKANSITLYLEKSDVFAFDFDIYDADLFNKIYKVFQSNFGSLQTCRGKKGCKIFFRCDFKKRLKNTFAISSVYTDLQGAHKQEIEVKKGLSTVYGVYPVDTSTDTYLYDCAPDSEYIVNCEPYAVNEITEKQFNEIERIITDLIKKQNKTDTVTNESNELMKAIYSVYSALPAVYHVEFFRCLAKYGYVNECFSFENKDIIYHTVAVWHQNATETEKQKYIQLFNLYFSDAKYELLNLLALEGSDVEFLRDKDFFDIFLFYHMKGLEL